MNANAEIDLQTLEPDPEAMVVANLLEPRTDVESKLNNSFLNQFSLLAILSLGAQGVFFATQIVIANVLGSYKFGMIAYGIAIGNYGQVAVKYGLDRTMARDLIHHPENTSEIITGSYLLRIALFAFFLVYLVIAQVTHLDTGLSLGVSLVAATWAMKSLDLETVYDAWVQMRRHSVYNVVQRGASVLLVLPLLFFLRKRVTVTEIGLVYLFSTGLYLWLQHRWAYAYSPIHTTKARVWVMAKHMLQSNGWLAVSSVIGLSLTTITQVILQKLQGPRELGIYAAGWQFAMAAVIIINCLQRIGNPVVALSTRAETSHKTARKMLLKYCLSMLLLTGAIGLGMVLFAHPLMKVCFSKDYASGVSIVRILGVYCFCFGICSMASQYVLALHLLREYFLTCLFGGIVSVGSSFYLIHRHGIVGAAWAIVWSQIAATVPLIWLVLRNLPDKAGTHLRHQRNMSLGPQES